MFLFSKAYDVWGEAMKKRRKKKEKNYVYRFTMVLMCVMLAGLLYLINMKEQYVTMSTLKQFNVSDLNKLFFWEKLLPEDSAVSSNVTYQKVKDHLYKTGGNEVVTVLDGVVTKVEDTSIIVLCDNGVTMHYKGMKSVTIKKEERIKKGNELGTMQDNVELRFYLDDAEITMDEAIATK